MNIVYCRRCASEMHESAPSCMKCGAPHTRVAASLMAGAQQPEPVPATAAGTLGRWILALVALGLLSTLGLLLYPVLAGLGWAS